MRYCGGKQRISKDISSVLNEQLKEGQPFVDLFCGACNIISKIVTKALNNFFFFINTTFLFIVFF